MHKSAIARGLMVAIGYLAAGISLLPSAQTSAQQRPPPVPGVFTADGCNAVAFSQLGIDEFVGRIPATPGHRGCTESSWGLARFHVDWSSRTIRFDADLAMPPFEVDGISIYSAYDPFTVSYGGQVWVAFECAGRSIHTSVCMAPMRKGNGALDTLRATRPIAGEIWPMYRASASVPKLLAWRGHLYLYWSVVRESLRGTPTYEVSGRGIELDVSSGRAWAKGAGAKPLDTMSAPSVEVASPQPNQPDASLIADVFDVAPFKEAILVLSGRGGRSASSAATCRNPSDKVAGCYRLKANIAAQPLAPGGFDRLPCRLPERLKSLSMEYARLMRRSDGSQVLIFHQTQPTPELVAVNFEADCPAPVSSAHPPQTTAPRR